jgi:hypothetical protein
MNKKLLINLLILLFISGTAFVYRKAPAPCADEIESDYAFKAGEELTYRLFYHWGIVWLPAGEVKFRVNEHQDGWHFEADGYTYGSYEWFYKVRDRYESIVDSSSFLPTWSVRDIEEGGYKLYDELNYDHAAGKVESLRGRTRAQAEKAEYSIEPCVQDILTVMYKMRNTDVTRLTYGDELPVDFFLDKNTYSVNMRYKRDEKRLKIKGLGRFDTYVFSPELIGGDVFQEGTEMDIYVSRDKNKIPLLVESPLKVGSVKAVLKSYSNLKHELNAES